MSGSPLTLSIDGVMPRELQAPRDASKVSQLLKDASDTGCTVVPLGGGTMLELGAPLERVDVALSLEKLDQVLDHQPANLTVKVQAGMTLAALNRALAAQGQTLPLDPPFPQRATIGGILATNSSGPQRVRFGAARDLLIGLRVALADGQIVRGGGDVVKNVAGYDLPKLFVGSLGTLGVITEASFKIVPLPAQTATLVTRFDSIKRAADLGLRILHSPLLPLGVEYLNSEGARELRLGDGVLTLLRFGGLKSAVGQQLRDSELWARELGATSAERMDEDDSLWSRLADFVYTKSVLCRLTVLPARLGELADAAERIVRARGFTCSLLAHAVGVLLVSLEGPDEPLAAVVALRDTAARLGAQLVVQRAPREFRAHMDVWGPPGSDFPIMQRLKQAFDPNNVLNPGRFVGGI